VRPIHKTGSGPFQLVRSHAEPPLTRLAATSRWQSFGFKAEVLSYLVEEQYALCCYSEIRASRSNYSISIAPTCRTCVSSGGRSLRASSKHTSARIWTFIAWPALIWCRATRR
jgi:hypothetical protein